MTHDNSSQEINSSLGRNAEYDSINVYTETGKLLIDDKLSNVTALLKKDIELVELKINSLKDNFSTENKNIQLQLNILWGIFGIIATGAITLIIKNL